MSQKTAISDEHYVSTGGNVCPSCESRRIEGEHVEAEGATASQSVQCLDCGANWKDLYILKGYLDLEDR